MNTFWMDKLREIMNAHPEDEHKVLSEFLAWGIMQEEALGKRFDVANKLNYFPE